MSFDIIGTPTEAVTGTTHSHTTDALTLKGDLIHLQAVVDGGLITMVPDDSTDLIFLASTAHIRHTADTLGKQSWWAVADTDGEVTYDLTGVNGSVKSTQTIYRNSIGGGTWDLDSIVTSNTLAGGSFNMNGVTSLDNSLVVFSTCHDSNSGVTTPPPSMTPAAPNPTGGDSVGLRSYFEDITSGKAESQTIVYTGTDKIIGDLSVFTYTIESSDISGAVSVTLDDSTVNAVGQVGENVTGTVSETLADVSASISGQVGDDVTGTISETLNDVSGNVSGTVGDVITGTISKILTDTFSNILGQVGENVTGVISETLGNTSVNSLGQVGEDIAGSVSSTLDDTAINAFAVTGPIVTGIISVSLDNVSGNILGQTGTNTADENDLSLSSNFGFEDINLSTLFGLSDLSFSVQLEVTDINLTGDL